MPSSVGAYITAITVQAVITGAYFALFLICLRWLVFSDDGGMLRKGVNWPYLTIAIILFAFSLTAFVVSLQATLFISEGNNVYKNAHCVIIVRNLTS